MVFTATLPEVFLGVFEIKTTNDMIGRRISFTPCLIFLKWMRQNQKRDNEADRLFLTLETTDDKSASTQCPLTLYLWSFWAYHRAGNRIAWEQQSKWTLSGLFCQLLFPRSKWSDSCFQNWSTGWSNVKQWSKPISFLWPRVMSSNVSFCSTNSLKPKRYSFLSREKKKQQIVPI